jgi:hypothetical protein
MRAVKYDIAIKISGDELRHLIRLHAGRVEKTVWGLSDEEHAAYMKRAAHRMQDLLKIIEEAGV